MIDMNEIDKLLPRTQDGAVGRPSGVRVARPEGFAPPKISKPMTLQRMNERHHEMARLAVLGYKDVDIAKKLNISRASVVHAMNSPIVKAQLAMLRGARSAETVDLMDEIRDIMPDAVKLMRSVIDGGTLNAQDVRDRTLQVNTAKDILAIGGIAPIKRVEARTTTTHLTADDIKQLVAEARDLGMCVGDDVIDVVAEDLQTGT